MRTIVDHLMTHDCDNRLLNIAHQAVISRVAASREDLQVELGGDGVDPNLIDSAVAIADAGARIEREPNDTTRERRKAAVLERLVFYLVSRRLPNETTRETHIELTRSDHSGKSRTGKKDVVANARPFEAYECKFGGGIEQWEVDELGDVYLTAQDDGTPCVPGIVTMGSEAQLRSRLRFANITLHEVLYYAVLGDLGVLARRPISARLR